MARSNGFQSTLCATVVVCALGSVAPAGEPLRLVTDLYRGPYEHIEDDETPGFNIELVRQVFAAMGQDVSFEQFPNYRGWSMIAHGERDGLFRSPRNNERERICSFPDEPLVWDKWVLFVRTTDVGKLKFSSFDDLIGHDVAVWKSTPDLFEHPQLSPELWQFLREHHNIVDTSGTVEGLRMLAAGRVDYAALSLSGGMREIASAGLSGKVEPLLSRSVIEGGLYVCFTKARVQPTFVGAFSNALKKFKETEAFQALQRKYFSCPEQSGCRPQN